MSDKPISDLRRRMIADMTIRTFIGKWVDEDSDGRYDVLEIETRFLKDVRAYDVNGYPFADDGQTGGRTGAPD